MTQYNKDYTCVIFTVLLILVTIVGVICTLYGGLRINMQSTSVNANEQIFLAGVCLLIISGMLILMILCMAIFDKIHETPRIDEFGPVVVVKPNSKKMSKQNSPLPPDPPIPKHAYYSYKENPIVKFKRERSG